MKDRFSFHRAAEAALCTIFGGVAVVVLQAALRPTIVSWRPPPGPQAELFDAVPVPPPEPDGLTIAGALAGPARPEVLEVP